MHLQGAIAAPQGDAPLTVTQQLNFVVAGLLDVQLDEDVFVVATPLAFTSLRISRTSPGASAAAASICSWVGSLVTSREAPRIRWPLPPPPPMALRRMRARGNFKHRGAFGLHLSTQLFNTEQVKTFVVGSKQNMIRQRLKGQAFIRKDLFVTGQVLGLGQRHQTVTGGVIFYQSPCRDIINPRCNGDVDLKSGALGFVFFCRRHAVYRNRDQ